MIIFILIVLIPLMKYLQMPIPKSYTIAIVVISWGLGMKFDPAAFCQLGVGSQICYLSSLWQLLPFEFRVALSTLWMKHGPAASETQVSFLLAADLHNFLY